MKNCAAIFFDPQGSKNIDEFFREVENLSCFRRIVRLQGNSLKSLILTVGIFNIILLSVFKFRNIYFEWKNYNCLINKEEKIARGIDDYVKRRLKLRKLSKIFGIEVVNTLNKIYWFFVAMFLKKVLNDLTFERVFIFVPDEAYSIPSVIKFNCSHNVVWISNINSYTLGLNVFNYTSPDFYRFPDRTYWTPFGLDRPEIMQFKVESYFSALFNSKINHHDYGRTYRLDKPKASTSSNGKLNILIASHILCDAPSNHVNNFNSFEEWILFLLSTLTQYDDQYNLYVKEHPSVDLYEERGLLLDLINIFVENKGVNFISSDERVNLNDFDIVFTCNGSVAYECNFLGVSVVSCSDGFTRNLSNVCIAKDAKSLEAIIPKLKTIVEFPKCIDYQSLYNWILGRSFVEVRGHDTSDKLHNYVCDLIQELSSFPLDCSKVSVVSNGAVVLKLTN